MLLLLAPFAIGAVVILGLFVLYAIGGGDRTGVSGYSDLAWSPDGRQFANVRYDTINGNDKWEIRVQAADGGGKRTLTDHGERPDWSPDGK